MKSEYRRRHKDLFSHSVMASTFDARQPRTESWRELVSMGLSFGLGLSGLAALVMFLTQ